MAENLRQDLIRSKEEEQKASCLHTKIWVQTEKRTVYRCRNSFYPLGKHLHQSKPAYALQPFSNALFPRLLY